MADGTKIEWTDATWNPIVGCSVVSAGCKHCYAMKLAGTRLRNHPTRQGLTDDTKAGPVWNGQVRFNDAELVKPLSWRKPRRIFVCAHGDLFHENIPDEWIDRVFAVMALAPQHTFQVLTKRPERMRAYLKARNGMGDADLCEAINAIPARLGNRHGALEMPLPNVWLGVSVEDQAAAEERIPILLDTPAAVRFLSCEPLLGQVDLRSIPAPATPGIVNNFTTWDVLRGYSTIDHPVFGGGGYAPRIDWVIAGGESGPGARPAHPDWFRSLRDQCAAAGVPFLFKQWGEWHSAREHDPDSHRIDIRTLAMNRAGQIERRSLEAFELGADPTQDDWLTFCRVGKKAAGRLLDGVEHHAFPEVSHGA